MAPRTGQKRRGHMALWTVTGMLFAAFAGGVVGFLVTPVAPPPTLRSPSTLSTVSGSKVLFDDLQDASLSVEFHPGESLISRSTGLLTESRCQPGAETISGTSLFGIDGTRIVNLATALPLWRDIHLGDQGDDVRALQTELARMGHSIRVDGRWKSPDFDAYSRIVVAAGSLKPTEPIVSVDRIAWLPAPSVVVETCAAPRGNLISDGTPVAGFSPQVSTITITNNSDLTREHGARIISIGDVEFPLPEDGFLTDPAVFLAVVKSPEFRSSDSESNPRTVSFSTRLTTPIDAVAVSPAALSDVRDGTGCVQQKGAPIHVTILASQLGLTLVQAAEGDELSELDVPAEANATCR